MIDLQNPGGERLHYEESEAETEDGGPGNGQFSGSSGGSGCSRSELRAPSCYCPDRPLFYVASLSAMDNQERARSASFPR